jgi:isoleucyl-tRNA synthetase
VSYHLKPLPKQLGQKYQSEFPAVRRAILKLEAEESARRLLAGKPLEIMVEGERYRILPEEVELRVEAHEGLAASAEGPYLAALVTTLTPELEREGLAREVVRRIQDLRKQADLEVDALIEVEYKATEALAAAIAAYKEYVQSETLAVRLAAAPEPEGDVTAQYSFEQEEFHFALRVVEGVGGTAVEQGM